MDRDNWRRKAFWRERKQGCLEEYQGMGNVISFSALHCSLILINQKFLDSLLLADRLEQCNVTLSIFWFYCVPNKSFPGWRAFFIFQIRSAHSFGWEWVAHQGDVLVRYCQGLKIPVQFLNMAFIFPCVSPRQVTHLCTWPARTAIPRALVSYFSEVLEQISRIMWVRFQRAFPLFCKRFDMMKECRPLGGSQAIMSPTE